MKKQIIITLILLSATAYATIVYFKNLNTPGMRTSKVMQVIPDNASLIFEFNNDKGFYDIFNGSKLFVSIVGKQKIADLDTLKDLLLQNPSLEKYFSGQNIFVSVHPSKTDNIGLLVTISSGNGFDSSILEDLSKLPNSGFVVTPLKIPGSQGYTIYINSLKKRFYITSKGDDIFSGSFTKDLVDSSLNHKNKKDGKSFELLSEQQSTNSLANLYINFEQISPLLDQLFQNKNTDILRTLRILPGLATLSLNYRNEALMFNGSTSINQNGTLEYLNLFINQQPVVNHIKDIFPSTTAYSITFGLSDPLKFSSELSTMNSKANLGNEKGKLLNKIKAETGKSFKKDFDNQLGNEFAVVTTRYFEKFAIISVKNGSKIKSILNSVSTMSDENTGQLNYEKLPFFLLGDALESFRRPYFTVIDNYLILANSMSELKSYNDIYINRKFLSKNEQNNQFNNLLTERSNISYFLSLRNVQPILERDLYPSVYQDFKSQEQGLKDFYAASVQLSASDKNFYTNLCLKLNTDSADIKPQIVNQSQQ
ncbi:hypothetical protein HDF24_17380 [Mucilaginibacter sp. X4EP1]|uniref:hypothetical protein n=1 Tax=Mucilaginibacter sp. X4EP1 TaxID=2723092 RepID=UPI0021691F40|nr:hypothetical protein [Mucilaginibacter sp. X4EP1]MCS3815737.1 putative membrane protein [Mucilaginibacter sp. X4EP1]